MGERGGTPMLALRLWAALLLSAAAAAAAAAAAEEHVAAGGVPPYCRWESAGGGGGGAEGSLLCLLRPPRVNVSEIPGESLTSLGLVCLADSLNPLPLADLQHLWRLRALRVAGCRIGRLGPEALGGLASLRNLSIRAERGERLAVELEPRAFDASAQLEKLDLSGNSVRQLPARVFCPLRNLLSLNLSRNLLEDLAELEFGPEPRDKPLERKARRLEPGQTGQTGQSAASGPPGCQLELRELDVSHNRLARLGPRAFASLRRLGLLNLAGNAIGLVEDDALGGLRSLRSLDLSSNRIVALPGGLFREAAHSLKELKLQNNSLGALAPGLVADMDQLVALDLSRNALGGSSLGPTTFAGLIRLVLLDLSFNEIDRLEPGLFTDLYTLQILNLKYNEIESIGADAFSPLSNLHTLEISHNRLTRLEAHSLNGLFALSLLAANYNLLEHIHPDAFRNCSSIEDVQLSGNALDAVPAALRDMGVLKMLDLGENRIEQLERANFEGMGGLYGLRLMSNQLSNLSRLALAELPALQILNLARNRIQLVDPEAFRANPMLQAIRLDSNLLGDLSGPFANVSSLLWLNVSDNLIERFDYGYLPARLQWLDIHRNGLVELGPARPDSRLQTLDASFNRIERLGPGSVPPSLELLFLNDNQIHSVAAHTFLGMVNLTRVDLYANQIVRMELSALQLSQLGPGRELPEFYIGGNPFVCDCTTEWLQRINGLGLGQHPKVMDLHSVYCRLPYDRRRSFVPLLDARPSQFLCAYAAHCFALCHCCDFDACDCEMTCPANCTCYHDESWSANVVDCSSSGYKRLPGRLPMDATEVYLDGNDLGELTSHSFIGRKNLEVLYANDSNIVSIRNLTFSGLRRLAILHLENNRIAALHGTELAPMEALKELYLHNNQLAHVDNATFLPLRRLEILRLDNNRLSSFALWQLQHNPYLVDVSIAGNPWHCGCGYVEQLREWMLLNREKLSDWRRAKCSIGVALISAAAAAAATSSNNGSSVVAAFPSCTSLSSVASGARERPLDTYLPLLLVGGGLLLALLLLLGVAGLALGCGAVGHRRALRHWAASRCGLRACYKTAAFEDREKPFDAYISYSAVDEQFVSRVLVPGLESSYRLCLHYRDLGAGSNVADAVQEAADSSRRTILVLSRNFLAGEWARFEFKLALREALKGRGRNVILLLVGGVCPRDLDGELRKRISSHTLLVWGDKLFWQKLRFAMPEMPPVLERPPSLPPPPPPPQLMWA